MKTLIVTLILLCSVASFAQTKLIFHKSHSGSGAAFEKTIRSNYSSFGAYPIKQVTNSSLDSVIYLTDISAIMITSEYCRYLGLHDTQNEGMATTKNLGSFWRAGRDTVYNHPLFTRKHALDSIRMAVKMDYYFSNDIDSTKFVGYDNVVAKDKEVVKQPVEKNGNEVYLLLVFVIALLLFSMLPAARSSQVVR